MSEPTVEGPGSCTKHIWEPCRLHPTNCASCRNRVGCQLKADVQAHPDKIKRCRFYEEGASTVHKTALGQQTL